MQGKSIANKSQFSEYEAAQQLGLSVEELRSLIRRHITADENDARNLPMTSFQHTDLLLLRLLSKHSFSTAV
jgi:hypothetical protein